MENLLIKAVIDNIKINKCYKDFFKYNAVEEINAYYNAYQYSDLEDDFFKDYLNYTKEDVQEVQEALNDLKNKASNKDSLLNKG